jgi:hypothetical protein
MQEVHDDELAQRLYADLVTIFNAQDGVDCAPRKGFGSSAITVRGRIAVMLVRGRLVAKLPKARVDALVAEGRGVRFDANKGTPMKEWLVLASTDAAEWRALGREALAFAGA